SGRTGRQTRPSRGRDPPRPLAPRPPPAPRPRQAASLRRRRPGSARPLASISHVAHTGPLPARAIAALCRGGGPLARVPGEPVRRHRGVTMAKTYKEIMDEAKRVVPEVSPDDVKSRLDRGDRP